MLGYEYGYLNFPKQASQELDKTLQLNPKDAFAATLRNQFGAKVGLAAVPVPKPTEAPQGGQPATPAGGSGEPAGATPVRTTSAGDSGA